MEKQIVGCFMNANETIKEQKILIFHSNGGDKYKDFIYFYLSDPLFIDKTCL